MKGNSKQGIRVPAFKYALLLAIGLMLAAPSAVEAFSIITNAGKTAYFPSREISFELYGVPSKYESAIEKSFQAWADVPGVSIDIFPLGFTDLEPVDEDGANTISWVEEGWGSLPFFPPDRALAVTLSSFDDETGEIVDADIYINAEFFDWGNLKEDDLDSDIVDMQNVMTHEVGHLLGLDHSSEAWYESESSLREATMFFSSAAGDTRRRSLEDDDKNGILHLYSEEPGEAAEILSAELVSSSGGKAGILVKGNHFGARTSFVLSAQKFYLLDRPASFVEILSDEEAIIHLNLSGWGLSNSYLIASNSPTELSMIPFDIKLTGGSQDAGDVQANSTRFRANSGGGGCQIQSAPSSIGLIGLMLLSLFGLVYRRRRT